MFHGKDANIKIIIGVLTNQGITFLLNEKIKPKVYLIHTLKHRFHLFSVLSPHYRFSTTMSIGSLKMSDMDKTRPNVASLVLLKK